MGIAISEDHLALEETASRFAAARIPASVPRAVLETKQEQRPPFWDDLAALGWIGLAAPESAGGQGYGLAELVVVAEALGRAVAPGPFLPSALAATLLGRAGVDVSDIVDGSAVATVALSGALSLDGDRVSGTLANVLCGAIAEVVVARAGERWVVLRAGQFEASEVGSLDPTRRLATVTVEGAPAEFVDVVDVDRDAAVLFAAEATGGASWCVETAAEYAKVRQQFGRPIGQFQAVKHRCSDMLVALEQARSVTWDAAAALDSGDASELAACIAAAIAPDVFVRVAKDCIQTLGGIGFTWEHDAHLYLRRATSVRQLLGGASTWRPRVAALAQAGVRRELHLDLPASAEETRASVRAFASSVRDLDPTDQRAKVVDAGYFMPHWAEPWGRNAGAVEQLVIDEEFRAARIKRPNLSIGAWAAPTVAAYGTPEQQERWVRPTLTGEISWCQLFSEPGAGSDLAALTTSATKVDGGWLVNGQKVWTSMARDADWGICLVRTNKTAPKHLGITYVIVDMKSPGLEIRPLRELTGFAMFNEVFLTDLFVPDDCVIGEVDGGWPLARTTLANERVAMGSGSSFGGGVEALLTLVKDLGPLDPVAVDQLGMVVADAQSVALLGLRTTYRSLSGAKPGPEASVRKLLGVEHDQRTQELGLSLLGPDGATTEGAANQWTFGFLANRCLTIAGGTSEVQRNVIAERLLGLPRDP
jgi:alkylation response protein AidB-like acyl-CoA dehydrogenase